MPRPITPKPTYPAFASIFEAHEHDLVERLPTLFVNEPDRKIAQEVLLGLWRSCLITALTSFVERTRSLPPGGPAREAVALLCADVDRTIRDSRFLLDLDGRGRPFFDYVMRYRRAVGTAITHSLTRDNKQAGIYKQRRAREPTARRDGVQRLTASPRNPTGKRAGGATDG